jgi:ubiquinone/menaquinone biosynthesis C-methylase UbiE
MYYFVLFCNSAKFCKVLFKSILTYTNQINSEQCSHQKNKSSKDYQKFSKNVSLQHAIDSLEPSGIKKSIQQQTKLKILDVACGPADISREIANLSSKNNSELKMISTDFSQEMIKLALENTKEFENKCECFVMDGNKLEFEETSFDFTMSFFGLFYISDRKKGLSEMFRVLKDGGKAIIAFWKKNPFPDVVKETLSNTGNKMPGHVQTLTPNQMIENDLKEVGFESVEIVDNEVFVKFEDFEDFFAGVLATPGFEVITSKMNDQECEDFYSRLKENTKKVFSEDGKSANYTTSTSFAIATK